jgi:hypothetical protein
MRKLVFVTALLLLSGIAFGQVLKKDVVMMMDVDSELVLKPGVSMNAYIDFLFTTMKPELEKAWPGTKFIWLQGENVEKVNSMIRIWYFESTEVRDKYINPEGIYTDKENMGLMLKLDQMEREYVVRNTGEDNPPWPMNTSWLVL